MQNTLWVSLFVIILRHLSSIGTSSSSSSTNSTGYIFPSSSSTGSGYFFAILIRTTAAIGSNGALPSIIYASAPSSSLAKIVYAGTPVDSLTTSLIFGIHARSFLAVISGT